MKPLAPAVSPLHALHSRDTLDAALEDAEPVSRVRVVIEDEEDPWIAELGRMVGVPVSRVCFAG